MHKQSLLHHVCTIVVEKFPDSTDLYSEIGAITRSAKVHFCVQGNLLFLWQKGSLSVSVRNKKWFKCNIQVLLSCCFSPFFLINSELRNMTLFYVIHLECLGYRNFLWHFPSFFCQMVFSSRGLLFFYQAVYSEVNALLLSYKAINRIFICQNYATPASSWDNLLSFGFSFVYRKQSVMPSQFTGKQDRFLETVQCFCMTPPNCEISSLTKSALLHQLLSNITTLYIHRFF